MAHGNSRVWVSPRDYERDALYSRWLTVESNLARMRFDRSPFVPHTFAEFREHTAAFAEDRAQEARKRMENILEDRELARRTNRPPLIPFEGKQFHDNRSAVLSLPSIWAPWFGPEQNRPMAPWPTADEYKEEGDERHTSGFKRFLPVPRVPGNETVVWKQKAFLEQYELDRVNPVYDRSICWTLEDEIALSQMPVKMFTENPEELKWMDQHSGAPTPADAGFTVSWEHNLYSENSSRGARNPLRIEWRPASANSSRISDTMDNNAQMWELPGRSRQSTNPTDQTLGSPPTDWPGISSQLNRHPTSGMLRRRTLGDHNAQGHSRGLDGAFVTQEYYDPFLEVNQAQDFNIMHTGQRFPRGR